MKKFINHTLISRVTLKKDVHLVGHLQEEMYLKPIYFSMYNAQGMRFEEMYSQITLQLKGEQIEIRKDIHSIYDLLLLFKMKIETNELIYKSYTYF